MKEAWYQICRYFPCAAEYLTITVPKLSILAEKLGCLCTVPPFFWQFPVSER